jgi:HPr kinase/phosphorylase
VAGAGHAPPPQAGRDTGATLVHGTCIAINGHGVLLRGPSGSGKSDLALRLIMGPSIMAPLINGGAGTSQARAELVADDQVFLAPEGGHLMARPPDRIAGLIEVRGIGIVRRDFTAPKALALIVDLVAPQDVPRMRHSPLERHTLGGIAIPVSPLAPFEPSAPIKLHLLLACALAEG